MADIDSLAAALFGSKRAETQEVLTDATTRTYIGIALTDSVDGTVMVDLGGDVTLPDDIEGVSEYSAEGVEVATGPGVRAGDEVVVTLVGGTPLKTPMVTGVAGEGDGQDARIATASAAAEAAWDWADEAHDAATDAQASADSAASAASAAVISAASAEASAQQAIADAAAASSSAASAQASAQQAISDAAAASAAAASAEASAQQAISDANDAYDAAVAAQAEATLATQSANEAKGAATRANTAANDALTQLATVEDVIGVVDWVTEHGTYSLTTDTVIDPDKVYYTRTGSGTQADPYVYTAVAEPDVSDIGSYYELDIDEALSQYVASHLALTNAGLYVLKDSSGYKLLLANDGMQVIDPAGHTVATYGESITFDSERPQRIGGTDSYIEWRDANSDGVPDSLAIVADSIELSGGQSVSTGSGNVWANHSSATSASGISSWSDTFVAPTTAKPYVWMTSYSIIDGQRVYGNPACISGATGQQGPQGPQGETGDTGVGIQSYVQMWAKSTSSSVAPTSGWSASRPTSIGTNEHLWVRIDTTWTDNTTTQGTPVVDQNTTDLWHTSAALRVDVDSIDSDVSALQTTVSGHTTTISQHTTAIQQNSDAISLRATKTEVQQVRPAYASSSTAAGTAAKVATIDPAVTGYALYKGATVAVTFSTANTAATPTLNLNSTGAKQIRSYTGATLSEAEYKWAAGATIDLVYDGTYWRMQDSGSVKRVTAAEASIRVNADNIESKVSKDGVISSINQSAETIKIQASRVEIDGTAVFSAIKSSADAAYDAKGAAAAVETNSGNLFLGASMADRSTFINNSSTDFSKHFRYYNGSASIHSFSEYSPGVYQDTVTLNNSGNLGIAFARMADEMGLDSTSSYTITCWAKCSKAGMNLAIGLSYYNTSNSWVWRGGTNATAFSAADTWQKFSLTFKPDADTKAICYCFTVAGGTGSETFTIRNCWLEKNAAYDAQTTADAAAPKANAVKRTQRIWYRKSVSGAPSTPGTASSNWVTKADDGNDAWTKMHIAISSTHKYIYTCEQYEMANGTVGYTSVLLDNTITVIDGGNIITGSVTANKLNAADINASKTLTVGAMTDAAASTILNSNVQVGGRNLLVGSSTGTNWAYSTFDPSSVVYTRSTTATTESFVQAPNMTFEAGETYTLSCWAKSNGNVRNMDLYKVHVSGSGSHQSRTSILLTNEYQKIVWTFTCNATSDEVAYIRFDNNGSNTSGTNAILYIKQPKLERGNKATDWTPAPEDMATAESLAGTNESLEGAITDIGELSDQLVGTTTEQNKTIATIQTYLNSLRKDLDAEIQSRQQWLNFNAAEGLVIGAAGSSFKTVTTNTSQQFRSGGTVLAETSGAEFVAPIMRSDQLLIGNWMWTRRDNGNLSLKWIG